MLLLPRLVTAFARVKLYSLALAYPRTAIETIEEDFQGKLSSIKYLRKHAHQIPFSFILCLNPLGKQIVRMEGTIPLLTSGDTSSPPEGDLIVSHLAYLL